jgi:outer membrane lipoprotein-sorting protein
LRTIAYLPVESTPAALFVRETIRLSGDIAVVGVERGPAVLRLTLVQAKDPRAGRLVLAFGERPFALANWAFVDAQGQTTRVTLVDAREGGVIAPARFEIEDPSRTRPSESR